MSHDEETIEKLRGRIKALELVVLHALFIHGSPQASLLLEVIQELRVEAGINWNKLFPGVPVENDAFRNEVISLLERFASELNETLRRAHGYPPSDLD